MDDLGAEHLSQLSSSSSNTASKKSDSCAIFDSSSAAGAPTNQVATAVEKDAKSAAQMHLGGRERDGKRLVTDASGATCVASNNGDNVAGDASNGRARVAAVDAPVDDDSDGKEKADVTPENLKKIVDDVMSTPSSGPRDAEVEADTPGSKSASDGISSPTTSADQVSDQVAVDDTATGDLQIIEDESPTKQALAFTIDFSDGMEKNAAAAAATSQKYRNMVERFQSRHRRGASMSKIEDQPAPTTPVTGRTPRVGSAQSVRQKTGETSEANKVKMRIRDRSTSGVRDANKRHSWSPRSSTHEPLEPQKPKEVKQVEPARPSRRNITTTTTTTNSIAPQNVNVKDEQNTKFAPRSTAMQLALNKVEFSCPQPPLDDIRKQKKLDDDESVSEAGTYTVDGDNYTEEQKELMNIDKSNKSPERRRLRYHEDEQLLTDTGQSRPTDLPLHLSSSIESRRRNNVLEISYYHDSTSLKPKISYLEKIKSRVKSITKSPDKQENPIADRGMFTSVTTSGVLSKKPTLDARPKLQRKNSLTKSHIDSSEYVSADTSSKSSATGSSVMQSYPNTAFTDHQKAEYKLNVFAKQSEHFTGEITPLQTPESPPGVVDLPDTTVLKTAQTKSDWIQEWARNARARSATVKSNNSDQMSRSFNFESCEDSMLSDPIAYHSKQIDRYRHHRMGDMEYASDTNLSNRKIIPGYDYQNVCMGNGNVTARPPLSPSKIPSPVHTVGRTRAVNRTRGSLQDLSPNAYTPETDVYLQKTAAAISNLAQSLSRKNSLQSSPSSNNNSPRRGDVYQPCHQSQHYSADEYSPTHNNHHHQQGLHKRHLSQGDYRTNLMSHSLNSDQLNGMLVDYRSKQHQRPRQRQNSFDAAMYSPRRVYPSQPLGHSIHQHPGNFIEQTNPSIKHQPQQQSPIRRSSSFSNKVHALGRTKGIANQSGSNKGAQSRPPLTNKNTIQKSASSTSFRKMYSDYDDNIEYYINDEDDLVDDYCSSDEFDDPNEYYAGEAPAVEPVEPLTNTRYNKALLMRIERSKQKVAGNNPSTVASQGKPLTGGVIACPNTPEMPRRSAQNAVRSSLRQSVPRDSSLNRLRGEVPNSLASAKKQLLQTATQNSVSKKVQPKYMDISKYKTNQSGNFLRKDGSKSTLVSTPRNEIKRSPSSASVVLNRSDPVRASNRSVKSAGGKPSGNPVAKQKENELAMWRRRATYDPMKAAAEGRRKQEEAKRTTQPKTSDRQTIDSYRGDF